MRVSKTVRMVKVIRNFIIAILLFFVIKGLKNKLSNYNKQVIIIDKSNEIKKLRHASHEYANYIINCLEQNNFLKHNIEQQFKDLLVLKYNLIFFDEDCIDISEVIAIEKLSNSLTTINKLSSSVFIIDCNEDIIKSLEKSVEDFMEAIGSFCPASLQVEIFDKLWIYIFKKQILLSIDQNKINSLNLEYEEIEDISLKIQKTFKLLNKESIKEARKFKDFRGDLFQFINLIKQGILILDRIDNNNYLNECNHCIHKHILAQYQKWKENHTEFSKIYSKYDMEYIYSSLLNPLLNKLNNKFEKLFVIYQNAESFLSKVSFLKSKSNKIFKKFRSNKNQYKDFITAYKDLKYKIYGYDKNNLDLKNKLKLFYFKEHTYQLYLANARDWLEANGVKKELCDINNLLASACNDNSLDELINNLISHLKEKRIDDLDEDIEESWINRISNAWSSLLEKRSIINYCISNQLIEKPLSCSMVNGIYNAKKDLEYFDKKNKKLVNSDLKTEKTIENFVMTYLLTSKYEKLIEKDINCFSVPFGTNHICSNDFIKNLLFRTFYTKLFKLCFSNNLESFENLKASIITKLNSIYQSHYQNSCLVLKELEKELNGLLAELKPLKNLRNKSYLSITIKELIDNNNFTFESKYFFDKFELFSYSKFEYLVYMYLKNNLNQALIKLQKNEVKPKQLISSCRTDLLSTMNEEYLNFKYFKLFFESLTKTVDIYFKINLNLLIVEFNEYINNIEFNEYVGNNVIIKDNISSVLQNYLVSLYQPIDYNIFVPIFLLDELCTPIEYMSVLNDAYKIAVLRKDTNIDWLFFSNDIESELRENSNIIKDYICILLLKDDMKNLKLYPLYKTSISGLDKIIDIIDKQQDVFVDWLNKNDISI